MNSIESNFVPYQIAVDMKSIGFDEPCLAYWDDDKSFELNSEFLKGSQMDDSWLNTPTFSQTFKFFREKYKLHSYIDITIEDTWYFSIFNLNTKRNSEVHIKESYFETFEEAELECLVKLIEIVKTK